MLLRQRTGIIIDNTPDAIWDYANDPDHWTASNPEEHYGLRFDSPDNRPHTGVTFHQREKVASFYADLRGQVLYAEYPRVLVWTGVATYPIGFLRIRIPEGGLLVLEDTAQGTRLRHNVFMDFPDSPFGRFVHWLFVHRFKGEQAVYDHTYRELVYFKGQLEAKRELRAQG